MKFDAHQLIVTAAFLGPFCFRFYLLLMIVFVKVEKIFIIITLEMYCFSCT
jgi:hypothetical protein